MAAVQVRGLRELQRDFRKLDKDLSREVRASLRETAEPVRVEAARLFAPISAHAASGYKVRVRQRGVAIEQSQGRTTGKRPDFGRRQMGRALIPALEAKREDVVAGLGKTIDRLAGHNGF